MKFWTLTLHISFILIICGALLTTFTGERGRIALETSTPSCIWEKDGGESARLPFTLELRDFSVSFHSGSRAVSDYTSSIVCMDGDMLAEGSISMNRIFRHRGYRFVQQGYADEGRISILSVVHDPWGISVCYSAYALLLISLFGFFFQKRSRFRALVAKLGRSSAAAALLLLPLSLSARNEELPVLDKELAGRLGELNVYYNDRVAPLETLARDYCLKLYGSRKPEGYSEMQVLSGLLFHYGEWCAVPLKLKASDKGGAVQREKESLRMDLATGEALRIFPVKSGESLNWFSCEDALPEELDYDHWLFIRKTLDLLQDDVKEEKWEEVESVISKLILYQEKTASEYLPSEGRVKAERLYNAISRPGAQFMASLGFGLLLFVLLGISFARDKAVPRKVLDIAAFLVLLLWLYLSLVLALHWYVSGHVPFAGSYCVMMLMAWLSCTATLLLRRRFPVMLPLGLLLAGFTMLVARIACSNPQITRLMPVLQSPLLSVHVLAMMLSYTLFGLLAIASVLGLFLPSGKPADKLRDLTLVVLYPAEFLLAAGIVLGSVWAGVSWGSYWSWDPKETWALITVLVYAVPLHSRIRVLHKPRALAVYFLLAFLCVLMTYFGVNLFLGGMHAYA